MENWTPEHSLVVLTYTKPDLIRARAFEVANLYGERDDVEFLIFDNGSNEFSMRLELAALSTAPQLTHRKFGFHVERVEPNVGFGGGWNAAIPSTRGSVIHLLSDDVRITGDIIGAVERAAMSWGGPDWIVGQQRVMAGGWNQFNGFTIPYLMGYYLAMPRNVWDRLGGFDAETFHPYDFEDVDLSHRAAKFNVALLTVPDLPLVHEVAGTIGYSPERYEHTVRMRAAFARKHGLRNEPERP